LGQQQSALETVISLLGMAGGPPHSGWGVSHAVVNGGEEGIEVNAWDVVKRHGGEDHDDMETSNTTEVSNTTKSGAEGRVSMVPKIVSSGEQLLVDMVVMLAGVLGLAMLFL
jgi:hypothetical protein